MKDVFKSNGFKLLIAIIFIFLGVLVYTANEPKSPISTAVNFITTPLRKASASLSYAASNLLKGREDSEKLKKEVDELNEEIQRLRLLTVDYYDLKKENVQFRKYYDLKKKDESLKFVPASVIGRDPNESFYGFSLDEGYIAGILEDDPVITENGLVGWVYQVEANSCKVRTVLSPETKVGVIDVRSGDSGVVTGAMPYADENQTRMLYISPRHSIEIGDLLATSGLSGIYPKDLLIGKVKEIRFDEYDASLFAIIELFEDIRNVRDVFIVTDFQGKGQVTTTPLKEQIEQIRDHRKKLNSSMEG